MRSSPIENRSIAQTIILWLFGWQNYTTNDMCLGHRQLSRMCLLRDKRPDHQ